MQFTNQQLAHFQQLYSLHFGQSITKKQAAHKGAKLVQFVKEIHLSNKNKIANHDKNTNQTL
jgi:hypothetical protein